MSHAIAFDTYAYIKALKWVGVSEKQAEAEVQGNILAKLADEWLVTEEDLARGLKEFELRRPRERTLRLAGIMAIGIVVVATFLKLF